MNGDKPPSEKGDVKVDQAHGTVDFQQSKWGHETSVHATDHQVNGRSDGVSFQYNKDDHSTKAQSANFRTNAHDGQFDVTERSNGEHLHWDNKNHDGYITDKSGHRLVQFHNNGDLESWIKGAKGDDIALGLTAHGSIDKQLEHDFQNHKKGEEDLQIDRQGDAGAVTGDGKWKINASKNGDIDVTGHDGHHYHLREKDGKLVEVGPDGQPKPVDQDDLKRLFGNDLHWNAKDHSLELADGTKLERADGNWRFVAHNKDGKEIQAIADGKDGTADLKGGMFGEDGLRLLPNCTIVDRDGQGLLKGLEWNPQKDSLQMLAHALQINNGGLTINDNGTVQHFGNHGEFGLKDKDGHDLINIDRAGNVTADGEMHIDANGDVHDSNTGTNTKVSGWSGHTTAATQAASLAGEASSELADVSSLNFAPGDSGGASKLMAIGAQISALANQCQGDPDLGSLASSLGSMATRVTAQADHAESQAT